MALGSTQPLIEMKTTNIFCEVKAAATYGWQPHHFRETIILKYGNLKVLKPQSLSRSVEGLL